MKKFISWTHQVHPHLSPYIKAYIVNRFYPMSKTYAEAQEFCETAALNGFTAGRLFEPKTQSFNDKVYAESIVVFRGSPRPWIGINRKQGSWFFTGSGTELEFQNWYPGQPTTRDRPPYSNCVLWYGNGKWYDVLCDHYNPFICEFF